MEEEQVKTFDEQGIRDLLPYYQKLLRLQDWRIDLSIGEIPGHPGSSGHFEYNLTLRCAKIYITDLEHFPEDAMEPQDMEEDLVHELLHIHFVHLGRFKNHIAQDCLEGAIESIAEAIVALRRG